MQLVTGGAPEHAASQGRDVAGSKADVLSQAPSPGFPAPTPQASAPAATALSPSPKVQLVFSGHGMCAFFCVP